MKYRREIENIRRQVQRMYPEPEHFRINIVISSPVKTPEGKYTGEFSKRVHVVEFDSNGKPGTDSHNNHNEFDMTYEDFLRWEKDNPPDNKLSNPDRQP